MSTNAVRRGLLLAGLAVAGWAVIRATLLLSGNDDVVADDDPHGYVAIFSLVLIPVLLLAVGTLLACVIAPRSHRIVPGVALVLSAPLASPLALVAAAIGVAILVDAVVDRRRSAREH
ncbi:hypothetical protein [Actinophytocola algeriensis]|uniref:Uncharacterized membrane protein YoaK (UPF0700 family) n=1 Tax=Actinophytocola algeriensis TaxID=1768010 RepID=A0A7W7QEJ1_9PSEU|nr:hypothetical protein [Actinophytocola algeriensis]MBB4912170.1 uncharacterized membrane protein YoaK (UPF0700 family) [Actinophytocola algeriensis]MBE1474314.1 uncharacterized membrane protein YoaK (UPF0700 family) [Actinophytocola algeriensis]